MTDAVKRAAEAEVADGVDFHLLEDDELRELEEPGTEYQRPISLFDPRVPLPEETDEDEVTEENYESFLPDYTDLNPPHINVLALQNQGNLLGADGKLLPGPQAEWDETPPNPQDSFEDSEGV